MHGHLISDPCQQHDHTPSVQTITHVPTRVIHFLIKNVTYYYYYVPTDLSSRAPSAFLLNPNRRRQVLHLAIIAQCQKCRHLMSEMSSSHARNVVISCQKCRHLMPEMSSSQWRTTHPQASVWTQNAQAFALMQTLRYQRQQRQSATRIEAVFRGYRVRTQRLHTVDLVTRLQRMARTWISRRRAEEQRCVIGREVVAWCVIGREVIV